jgi:hypothetical protein
MRRQLIIGGVTLALIGAACGPPPVPPHVPPPVLNDPAKCGQTMDRKAIVALAVNAGLCTRDGTQKLVVVAEECGPLFGGSNAVDDCWRGSIPGRPSPDNFRLGTILAYGGQAINFVASDFTAT